MLISDQFGTGKEVDLDSISREEKDEYFEAYVRSLGKKIGGKEEGKFGFLGMLIVQLHSNQSKEQRKEIEGGIKVTYDQLAESTNPAVGEAVLDIMTAEIAYFTE